MFSFILNQANDSQQLIETSHSDEEIFAAEAIQGDMALILKVKELNELIEFSAEPSA